MIISYECLKAHSVLPKAPPASHIKFYTRQYFWFLLAVISDKEEAVTLLLFLDLRKGRGHF